MVRAVFERIVTDGNDRLGLTKTGQGARIEAISRGVIGLIVPGGSEDGKCYL